MSSNLRILGIQCWLRLRWRLNSTLRGVLSVFPIFWRLLGIPRRRVNLSELETTHAPVAVIGATRTVTLAGNPPRHPPGVEDASEIGASFEAPPYKVFRLDRARIFGPGGAVVTEQGDIVTDGLWCKPPFHIDEVFWRLRFPRARRLHGRYCTIASNVAGGYYHWIMECLPRLIGLEVAGIKTPDMKVVVNGALSAFQQRSLELLHCKEDALFRLDRSCCEIDTLFVPTNPKINPLSVEWLRSRFAPLFATDAARLRLYVSRSRAGQRKVVNEDDLLPVLQRHGFQVIHTEDLDLAEQVRAFSQAEMVAGPHGAGLVNMVFAREGCKVVELCHPFYAGQYIYYLLASTLGFPYRGVMGQAAGAVSKAAHQTAGKDHLVVCPEELDKALAEMTSH
jgi:hypothetical protein